MNVKKQISSEKKTPSDENDLDKLKQKLISILKSFEVLTVKQKLGDKGSREYIPKMQNAADKIKSVLDEILSADNCLEKSQEQKEAVLSGIAYNEIENKKNIDEHLFVTEGNKPQFVKIHDIECITAFNEYTNVYLNNTKKVVIRKSLREWESVLPDTMFIRIHRSTIINFEYVDRVEKFYSRSFVVYLKNINQPFAISQRYLAKLKKKLFF